MKLLRALLASFDELDTKALDSLVKAGLFTKDEVARLRKFVRGLVVRTQFPSQSLRGRLTNSLGKAPEKLSETELKDLIVELRSEPSPFGVIGNLLK